MTPFGSCQFGILCGKHTCTWLHINCDNNKEQEQLGLGVKHTLNLMHVMILHMHCTSPCVHVIQMCFFMLHCYKAIVMDDQL